MSSGPIIEVQNLTKIYHMGDVEVPALRGVNLCVAEGEFISVVGPSGSGKSTLFHILGGLAPATSGVVKIAGRDLGKMTDIERTKVRRELVGFVFQKYNLLPTLTAADNIAMAQYISGKPNGDQEWFNKTLDMLGISQRLQHKPRSLSGGEQQRVAIARAIVNRPALLLADEPTGNLDSKSSDNVLKILRDLNERLNQTILMITHNPEAAEVAHRILHMRDGQLESAEE